MTQPAAELAERGAGHPPDRPLVLRGRAERAIEAVRRGVPVEHPPLEARIAPLNRDAREPLEQHPAETEAAVLRAHEEVLQPDPVTHLPRREGDEPDGDPADRPRGGGVVSRARVGAHLGDVAPDLRVVAEEVSAQVSDAALDRVGLSFVCRERLDELVDRGNIGGDCRANPRLHSRLLGDRGRRGA